jgi:hypothetical protein
MKDQHERADVYQRVTDQIIEAIESGAEEWRMPWHKGRADTFAPANAVSHRPFRGINVLNLWAIAHQHDYGSGLWAISLSAMAAAGRASPQGREIHPRSVLEIQRKARRTARRGGTRARGIARRPPPHCGASLLRFQRRAGGRIHVDPSRSIERSGTLPARNNSLRSWMPTCATAETARFTARAVIFIQLPPFESFLRMPPDMI